MSGIFVGENGEIHCGVSGVNLEEFSLKQIESVPVNAFRCSFCSGELNKEGVLGCKVSEMVGCRANKGSVVILRN